MKNFKLPNELGTDYIKPLIIKIKKSKDVNKRNSERTFTDRCTCEDYSCKHCSCEYTCSCNYHCNCQTW